MAQVPGELASTWPEQGQGLPTLCRQAHKEPGLA